VLTAGDAVVAGDLGDVIARDPEVRQARMIAAAARTRLLGCVTGSREQLDLAEAQRMLDALRNAQAHAGDAEDRVLVHRGLLTIDEAGRRAAGRRAAHRRTAPPDPADGTGTAQTRAAQRRRVGHRAAENRTARCRAVTPRNMACLLAGVLVCLAGVALARRVSAHGRPGR